MDIEGCDLLSGALKRISEAINSSLRREGEKPTIGVYRPSLLGACLLRQWLIYNRGLPISEEKAGMFKIGELFHGFLGNALRASEIEVLEVEAPIQVLVPFKNGPVWINGKADALIKIDGEKYVVEVKSIRRLPKQPLNHHVDQMHFYLAALNCKNGFIIYLEKSALGHAVHPVKFQVEIFNGLIGRAQRLHEALVKNERPKPDAQHWECKFCEFKEECMGYGGKT